MRYHARIRARDRERDDRYRRIELEREGKPERRVAEAVACLGQPHLVGRRAGVRTQHVHLETGAFALAVAAQPGEPASGHESLLGDVYERLALLEAEVSLGDGREDVLGHLVGVAAGRRKTAVGRDGLEEGAAGRFRGHVRTGSSADLVVFDPVTIAGPASFEAPTQRPEGIRSVLVSDVAVVRNGAYTGTRHGTLLRKYLARR